jgi:cell division protein FtsI (penicillin-binding protein 3)
MSGPKRGLPAPASGSPREARARAAQPRERTAQPRERTAQPRPAQGRSAQPRAPQPRQSQPRQQPSRQEQQRQTQPRQSQTRGKQTREQQTREQQTRAKQTREQQTRAKQTREQQTRAKQTREQQTRAKQTRAKQNRAKRTPGSGTVRQVRTGTGSSARSFSVRGPARPPAPADPRRRLHVALMVLLFVLSLFAGRLVQMQGLDGPTVARVALDKRTATLSLPAHRGDITDAAGNVLATTVDRRNILVDQNLVKGYERVAKGKRVPVGVQGAAEDLAKVLRVPRQTLVPKLTGTSRGALLAADVTPEVAREVLRLPIPGIGVVEASRRTYPAGTTAANLLGFVSSKTGQAFGGIEQTYHDVLAGHPGSLRYERGRDGTRIPTGYTDEVEPKPGGTVRLTIDRDLQWRTQQVSQAQLQAVEAQSIDVVILDAKTSDVLALSTVPTFDPNTPGRGGPGLQRNRPLLDVFEPGSTAKVITMAAALDLGVATPATRVTVPNRLKRADATFRDAEEHRVEKLTAAGVLAQSSNIGTLLIGERVPPERMYEYQRRFGLGARTGVGLAEVPGELVPAEKWSGSQRYTVMFGQGLSVTAMQAAGVFATVANDGVRRPPRLVAGVTGADGAFRPTPVPAGTRAVSAETARQVRLMLENVVGEHGTAAKAGVPGYRVAGKTGTAQAYSEITRSYSGYTASFIGMAPAEDPAIVIAVIVQNPVRGYFGGEVAAPVFAQLMTYALMQRKVPPTDSKPPSIPLRWQ